MPDIAVRETILSWVETQLDAIDGLKAFRNLTSRPDPESFPVAVLYDGSETVDSNTPQCNVITMDLDIEVWVSARTEKLLGPAIHDVLLKVSAALFADPSAGGAAQDIRYVGIGNVETDKTKGAPPMMGMLVNFEVDYWTSDNNLAQANP